MENGEVSNLAELTEQARKSGNTVRVKSGVYWMIEDVPLATIEESRT